ncbi:hypothetical protein ABW20_dc0100959 [Dactylellina cionopaga]|nr:hypothetical protein ABW20_dc0100959 [Dactylellina cionopaga]
MLFKSFALTLSLAAAVSAAALPASKVGPLQSRNPTKVKPEKLAARQAGCLPSPTNILGDAINGSPDYYQDEWASVTLPFPITIYSTTASTIWVSVNGVISLDPPPGSGSFINSALPHNPSTPPPPPYSAADAWLGTNAIAPLWMDLAIEYTLHLGIWYTVTGTSPSRTLTIGWQVEPQNAISGFLFFYIFDVVYEEANPGIVKFEYITLPDGGVSATIGAQSYPSGLQHSGYLNAGDIVTVDTVAGTIS